MVGSSWQVDAKELKNIYRLASKRDQGFDISDIRHIHDFGVECSRYSYGRTCKCGTLWSVTYASMKAIIDIDM
jgi:hypothetical protein